MNPFNDPIYNELPPPPVDPRGVIICTPSHDRRCDTGTVNSCLNVLPHLARNPFYFIGSSDICLARNMIAHKIHKHSPFEWLVWVDSDIIFSVEDWMYLWEGDEDIVTCPYAKKILGLDAAKYGLGFTRVHRSVFDKLDNLLDGDEKEVVQRFYMIGEMFSNFHPVGVTGDSRYHGEDKGFFLLASIANVAHRFEDRTRLKHVGPFEFGYPDQIADSGKAVTNESAFAGEAPDSGSN
jgi:hypothetical protein